MKNCFSLLLINLVLLSSVLSAQNGGQKIRVWQNGALLGAFGRSGGTVSSYSPTFSFTVTDDSTTIPNLPCPGNPCGWYKGFWILGDGNYKKYLDDNSNLDAASRALDNYTYAKSGNYTSVVYLTEKYHNENPPETGRATLQLNLSVQSPGTEITKRLFASPTKKIDIDYMHGLRVGYPTPFVLSYRKAEPATKVLFFYNSLKKGAPPSSWTAAPLMDYQLSELPDYFFSNAETVNFSNLANPKGDFLAVYGSCALNRLQNRFDNCLSYKVDNPSSVPSGFEEMRVFPILGTKKLENLPGGIIPEDSLVFVSFLLGSQALATNDPAYNAVYTTALSILGPPLSASMALSSTEYIRGIAVQDFKIGTSHDPNHLRVSRVEDLGGQKFRVYFELRICNHSETPETRPTLIFKDLSAGRFSSKPSFVGLNEKVALRWSPEMQWAATLKGYQISGAPSGMESCNDLEFYIDTDQAGAEWLRSQAPALEVCVEFSAGNSDCSENDPFIEKSNSSIGCGHSKWLWLSLLAFLAIGWAGLSVRRPVKKPS